MFCYNMTLGQKDEATEKHKELKIDANMGTLW